MAEDAKDAAVMFRIDLHQATALGLHIKQSAAPRRKLIRADAPLSWVISPNPNPNHNLNLNLNLLRASRIRIKIKIRIRITNSEPPRRPRPG